MSHPTRSLNRDAMNSASARPVANTAMAVIDRIQDRPAEHQLLGLAWCFRLVVERYGMTPQDVMTAASNLAASNEGEARPEFRGLRDYVEIEL